MLTRRQAITGSATAIFSAAADAWERRAIAVPSVRPRVPFGSCVRNDILRTDMAYRQTLTAHCQQLTPEGGLFWDALRPARGQFRFNLADEILDFATANGMIMRGHALVWYAAMPPWTKEIAGSRDAEHELAVHIEQVVSRYRGKVRTWHVVNEPIAEVKDGEPPGLRPSIWTQWLGDKYIETAFRLAHRVDPAAELIISDYDIEAADQVSPLRRRALLNVIRGLVDRGVPLHGVGIQGHIHGERPIDRDGLNKFAAEVVALGLSLHVTELDVIDDLLPGPPDVRDTVAAARAYDFLEALFAAERPSVVATWGITDRYTWVPTWYKRADSLANRPLPFDENYRPKPLWSVIDYFCRRAV
jgi:endo-1,4-beta-xylanase